MRRLLLFVCLASIAFTAFLIGQSSGSAQISGTIKDGAGARLPGVTVTLSSAALDEQERTALTSASGQYRFTGLGAGSYSITASLAGFRTTRHSAFTLPANTAARLDFALRPGRSEDVVAVTAAPVLERTAPAAREQDASRRPVEQAAGTPLAPMPGAPPRTDSGDLKAAGGGRGAVGGVPGGIASPGFANGIVGGTVTGVAGVRSRVSAEFNTEAYDRIDDNRWTRVSDHPLSTFSIDVDTASYANMRRFLNAGQRPPKDAIRIEELINYFTYDYDAPRGRTPVAITTSLAECPWNPGHRLALIGLQGERIDERGTPPRNLVFLVDVSGSMATPQKLPLVKSSLAMLARNLTASDRIAIVVYAGAAGVVLPPTEGNDRSTVLEALGRLQAGGSTNGGQGIQLAYRLARQAFIKGGVNRVLLATDGDFNVGVTSHGDLMRLIEENRDSGITLSVLGFGMGNLKDSTMEQLADKGNGNYSYIDSLSEAQKVLVEEAGGTLVTIAKDVKLQVEFNPRAVAAYRLIGYENRRLQDQDFNDDRKDAGDMGAGHSVTALYEIVPAGQPIAVPGIDPLKYQRAPAPSPIAPQGELMNVRLRYKQPAGEASALVEQAVSSRTRPTPALGFASAVAEFGMLLRDSEFKGTSSFAHARDMAVKYRGDDLYGHRAEFITLIDAAERLLQGRSTNW